jgi:hypothetical protein
MNYADHTEDHVMSVERSAGFEGLLEAVSQRLDGSVMIAPAAREALVLAIVQDVASFVLDWSEGTDRPAMHAITPFEWEISPCH